METVHSSETSVNSYQDYTVSDLIHLVEIRYESLDRIPLPEDKFIVVFLYIRLMKSKEFE
jgi:hypothetical protein